jgi:predicted ATPase
MLTISAKNFGPIVEGTVDLKPLTIFVGPSNTGKSYMATAVYAVMRAVEDRPQVPYVRNLARRGILPTFEGRWETPVEVADAIRDWVKQQDGKAWEYQEVPVSAMPEKARSELNQSTYQVLDWLHRDVTQQLFLAYRGNAELVNRASKPEDFSLTIKRDLPLLEMVIRLGDGKNFKPGFDISKASIPSHIIEYWGSDQKLDEEIYPDVYLEFFSRLRISAAEYLFDGLPHSSFFLPAARSGIAQGQRILAASIIRQSSLPGSQRVNVPALPGVTTEFLSDLVSLDRGMRSPLPSVELDKAISFIESNVLHGEIDLDESAGLPYPEIVYETTAGKFNVKHSSSMITELAPVVLFLKYLVRPGHLLIFEEPESHLHPAAQRQLARGIVRLVNAGVKVLITTHSDIFVSQINNLLALGQASPELVAEGGFVAEDFLRKDQVGAYLFRYSHELGGSEIVLLEIDPDTGIDEDEFAQVFEAIYDESIALQRDRN